MIRSIVDKLYKNRLHEAEEANDDLILIKAFQEEGDEEALAQLIDKYQSLIIKMTKRYFLNSKGDQDDLEQTALIGFWKAVSQFNGKGDFESYAAMMIKRELLDLVRKDNTQKEVFNQLAASLDAATDDDEGGSMTIGDTLADTGLTPEEAFFDKEDYNALKTFMKEKLTATEKEVLSEYLAGKKISQIADELNMKYKSVENSMMRVKNKINDYVKNKAYESEDTMFTDEEKKVLESVLHEIKEEDRMKEKLSRIWQDVRKR